MTDYRNFADSIFSSEIWQNEGRSWLTLTLAVFALAAVLLMFGNSFRNKKLQSTGVGIASVATVVALGALATGAGWTNDFNHIVAAHNVAVKYDTSKIEFLDYDAEKRLLDAAYTDKESNLRQEVSFTFEKGDIEPFLLKRYSTDETLENIEKIILKSE